MLFLITPAVTCGSNPLQSSSMLWGPVDQGDDGCWPMARRR